MVKDFHKLRKVSPRHSSDDEEDEAEKEEQDAAAASEDEEQTTKKEAKSAAKPKKQPVPAARSRKKATPKKTGPGAKRKGGKGADVSASSTCPTLDDDAQEGGDVPHSGECTATKHASNLAGTAGAAIAAKASKAGAKKEKKKPQAQTQVAANKPGKGKKGATLSHKEQVLGENNEVNAEENKGQKHDSATGKKKANASPTNKQKAAVPARQLANNNPPPPPASELSNAECGSKQMIALSGTELADYTGKATEPSDEKRANKPKQAVSLSANQAATANNKVLAVNQPIDENRDDMAIEADARVAEKADSSRSARSLAVTPASDVAQSPVKIPAKAHKSKPKASDMDVDECVSGTAQTSKLASSIPVAQSPVKIPAKPQKSQASNQLTEDYAQAERELKHAYKQKGIPLVLKFNVSAVSNYMYVRTCVCVCVCVCAGPKSGCAL